MKNTIALLLSILVIIVMLTTLSYYIYGAMKIDKTYVNCMKEKAETYCLDKGGVKSMSHIKPYVKCFGSNNNNNTFPYININTEVLYIFNESEINSCWINEKN